MKVLIHAAEGGVVGVISLEGESLRAKPEDQRMRTILTEPVRDPETGESVFASRDPKRFLRYLHLTYRSPYLWAGRVEN